MADENTHLTEEQLSFLEPALNRVMSDLRRLHRTMNQIVLHNGSASDLTWKPIELLGWSSAKPFTSWNTWHT